MRHRRSGIKERQMGKSNHERYDVVVLGSGVGGLGTAALLANKGYKTLVVEKLPFIGGRCSTLTYKGFKIPTGVMGVPMLGALRSIFDEVGAEFDVTPVTVPPKILLDGRIQDFPTAGPLDILSLLSDDEDEINRLKKGVKKAETWNVPSEEISLLDFLHQYTSNKKIITFFSNKCDRLLSAGASETSASEYFLAHQGNIKDFGKVGIAPHGCLALMKSLRKSIEANGGKVMIQCAAKKILVNDGAAEGVVLEDRKGVSKTILANVVVSNTGPKKTISLAGEEHFDKGYLQNVGNMLPSLQIWVTSVSDRPLFDTPVFITPGTQRMLAFMSPTLVCPDLAPKGKHVHYSISGPVRQAAKWDLKTEVNLHVQDLKDFVPLFKEHGEVLHVGCYRGGWPTVANTPLPGYRDIPQKTSIENLYNVGDGVAKKGGWSGGSPSCAFTARIVAEDIQRRLKPGQIL